MPPHSFSEPSDLPTSLLCFSLSEQRIEYKISLLSFQTFSDQVPTSYLGHSSLLHSVLAALLFCRESGAHSLTGRQLPGSESHFLSDMLLLSVLSDLPLETILCTQNCVFISIALR